MAYVEILQSEHLLEAMLSLGWEPGKRPPTYVDIRVKCKSLFGNGGDGNRIKELREQAITQALRKSGSPVISPVDASPPPRLPEELQSTMDGLASDITVRLNAFDLEAATYINRCRSDAEAAANARISAIRMEAAEQSAASDEEILAALSAIESRDATIADFEVKLSAALTATAHAEGRASALAEQVAVQGARIAELEREFKQRKTGSNSPAPKQTVIAAKPAVKNAGNTKDTDAKKSDKPTEPRNESSGNPLQVKEDAQVGGNL